MNATMMQIVVDTISFFATSDARAVDPDVAVAQLEAMSAALKRLTSNDLGTFVAFINDEAREAESLGDTVRGAFLAAIPRNLGLEARSS